MMWRLVAAVIWGVRGEMDPCIHHNTSYYDDSVPPVAVSYMKNAADCQTACKNHAPCQAWTFLSDAGACWQLPVSSQLILIGNDHGISGKKDCRPGATGSKTTWSSLAAAPTPPLSKGGTRPACSSRGKAFNDPKVQSMNGGYLKAATDCQQACSAAPLCVYWTYYKDTGACWLQGAGATEFLNAEAISGPKLCEDAAKASRYAAGHNITNGDQMVMMRSFHRPNCSFRGKALRDPALHVPNSYQESPEECQSLCIKTMSCSFFTFYIDSKACWLQGKNVTGFENAMAVSGPKLCGAAEAEPVRELQARSLLGRALVTVHRHSTAVAVLLTVFCSLALLVVTRKVSVPYRSASSVEIQDSERGLIQA